MGVDKALLSLGSENLLQRALRIVTAAYARAIIVGDRGLYASYGEVIEDRVPGCGPLGGIHAALSTTSSERNLILSVDMPLMTAEFLRWLVEQSVNGPELATVPRSGDRIQPLCAMYRRGMLPVVENAIAMGEYKVGQVFTQIATRYLSDAEMRAAGFCDEIFVNVNTPEDFERVKRILDQDAMAGAEALRR